MQNIFLDSRHDFEAKRNFQQKFESAGIRKPVEEVPDDEIWYLETEWVDSKASSDRPANR